MHEAHKEISARVQRLKEIEDLQRESYQLVSGPFHWPAGYGLRKEEEK